MIWLPPRWEVLYFQCIESRGLNRQIFAGLFQTRAKVGTAGGSAGADAAPAEVAYFNWPIDYFNWPIVAFTLLATDGGSGA